MSIQTNNCCYVQNTINSVDYLPASVFSNEEVIEKLLQGIPEKTSKYFKESKKESKKDKLGFGFVLRHIKFTPDNATINYLHPMCYNAKTTLITVDNETNEKISISRLCCLIDSVKGEFVSDVFIAVEQDLETSEKRLHVFTCKEDQARDLFNDFKNDTMSPMDFVILRTMACTISKPLKVAKDKNDKKRYNSPAFALSSSLYNLVKDEDRNLTGTIKVKFTGDSKKWKFEQIKPESITKNDVEVTVSTLDYVFVNDSQYRAFLVGYLNDLAKAALNEAKANEVTVAINYMWSQSLGKKKDYYHVITYHGYTIVETKPAKTADTIPLPADETMTLTMKPTVKENDQKPPVPEQECITLEKAPTPTPTPKEEKKDNRKPSRNYKRNPKKTDKANKE